MATSQTEDALALLPVGITSKMSEILDDLTHTVVAEVAAFQNDDEVAARLRASIEANVSLLTHVLQHAGDIEAVDAPRGAVDFALWIAQRGIPFSALLRAYTLCTARFYDLCLQEMAHHRSSTDTVIDDAGRLSRILHSYVDHVCERISKSYDTERERWLRQSDITRTERVLALLDRRPIDVHDSENALNYPLHGHHLAVIAWTDAAIPDGNELLRLQHTVSAYAEALECPSSPLVIPRDNSTLWAWLPLPVAEMTDTAAALEPIAEGQDHARFALGEPAEAAAGFVRSHEQATSAQTVALIAGTGSAPITLYSEVSSISFLCGNLDTTRRWITEVLGELAIQTTTNARLRDTLQVFLDCAGSYTAAAEILYCHKNTVQYRVRKAEAKRGRPINYRRLDLELALLASKRLGPAVLATPPTSPTE